MDLLFLLISALIYLFYKDDNNVFITSSLQDSSNFYLVMSARDDERELGNCQGPCHQVIIINRR